MILPLYVFALNEGASPAGPGAIFPRPWLGRPMPRTPLRLPRPLLSGGAPVIPVTLLAAIHAQYAASPNLIAALPSFFTGLAPARTPLPYACIYEIGETWDYSGTPDFIEDTHFQVSIFAETADQAKYAKLQWETVFNKEMTALSNPVFNRYFMAVYKLSSRLFEELEENTGLRRCFHQVIEFRVELGGATF